MSLSWLRKGLSENQARTRPDHADPSLRGRTYAIPFSRVWAAAFEMASGDLWGWTTVHSDEDLGEIRAESKTLVFQFVDDVEIRISLDENAQTRVDMESVSRKGTGDLGKNARRIKKFFRVLDKKIGAGPRTILDPTLSVFRALAVGVVLLTACRPAPDPPPDPGQETEVPSPLGRNFQSLTYERHIVFLTTGTDSTILVPWSFKAVTRPDGTDREIRGWLARSETWDPFLDERWVGPTSRAPWRILPRGPVRLVVGLGDALERIIFQEVGRSLEVMPGDLLVEWSGQQGQTYRVQEGTIILSDRTVEGALLDLTRAWSEEDEPPGDWGILLSGDSLQLVLEDLSTGQDAEGGDFRVWARVGLSDRQWQGVRLSWSETRSFEPARREIPMSWQIQSQEGDLEGGLTSQAPFLQALDGEGPVLPLEGLYQIAGTLTLDGRELPVRGFFRHVQR